MCADGKQSIRPPVHHEDLYREALRRKIEREHELMKKRELEEEGKKW